MNKEEQRAAIAEACGWKFRLVPSNQEMEDARLGKGAYEGFPGYPIGGGPLGGLQIKWWTNPSGEEKGSPPDYLSDLNAIQAAVMSLDDWDHGSEFDSYLFRILIREKRERGVGHEGVSTFDKIRATAPQRAEAFLRTLGLWTPTPAPTNK